MTSKDIIEEQLDGIDAAIKIAFKNLVAEGLTKVEASEFIGEYLQDYDYDFDAVPGEEEE
jgi:hypothetical protein